MWKLTILIFVFSLMLISCDSLVNDSPKTVQIERNIWLRSPNGGEHFLSGDSINIKWDSQNINSFNIYLSLNNGASWSTIAENLVGKSDFLLYPTSGDISDECLIKVCDYFDNEISDISDSNFKIEKTIDLSYLEYFQFSEGNIWVDSVHTMRYSDFNEQHYIEKSEYMGLVEFNNNLYHKIAKTNSLGEKKMNIIVWI